MSHYYRVSLMLLLVLCCGATFAAAQIPRTLTYQGSLKNTDGFPATGPVTLTVSLYDVQTGGSAPVWGPEIHQDEPLTAGVYTITLGKPKKGTPIPLTLAFDKPYYLQVAVGGVIMGRHELTSVPYAMRAASMDLISVSPSLPLPQVSIEGRLWTSLNTGQPHSSVAVFESRNQEPPYVSWNHNRTGGISSRYGYIQAGDFGNNDKRFMFVTDNDAKFAFIGNYVGIGTAAPSQRLDVAGGMRLAGNLLMPSSGTGILGQADRNFFIYQNTSAYNSRAFIEMWGDHATRAGELALGGTYIDLYYGSTTQIAGQSGLRLTKDGNVGIGTTAPQYKLDVNGTIRGTVVMQSDERWKTDIAPLDDALTKVAQLRGVTFHWKDAAKGAGTQIGVIAQEVEPVFPELVSTDSEGYKSVAYEQMVAPLIEAVKTLKAENDDLKRRVDALEAQIANQ